MRRYRCSTSSQIVAAALCALLVGSDIGVAAGAPRSGEIQIRVVDAETRQPLACRLHLKNDRGVARKVPKQPFLKDHFVMDGQLMLTLREGNYTFEAECGPEYHTRGGHFRIDRFADDQKTIEMKRFVNMAKEGWWSGDLHVRRPIKDMPLLMRGDDLHVAQVVTWTQAKNDLANKPDPEPLLMRHDNDRFYHLLAGRDHRAGGGLAYFHLPRPLAGLALERNFDSEYPPAIQLALRAKESHGVWIDAETAFGWDLPLWIAHGVIDSVRMANYRYQRDQTTESAPSDRPREKLIYDGPDGLGRWSRTVYYHLLNCGLRIPPTAGSGSGDVDNPVGYNRMYVYCGQDFSYDTWWQALRAGRVVVTNGPLLRPTVEGRPPGHMFRGQPGKTLRLQIELQLATKDKIEYLEVVKDGKVVHEVRLDEYAKRGGRLPMLEFQKSGWFLVRAVTGVSKTYRFAASAPYYVQIGDQPRISRKSARFFYDWVYERARQIKIEDPKQRAEVLGYHRAARDYWKKMIEASNEQ